MRARAVPDEDPGTIAQPADIGTAVAGMASERWEGTGGLIRFDDSKDRDRSTPRSDRMHPLFLHRP